MLIETLLKNKALPDVFTITKDASVTDAVENMNSKRIGALLVTDDQKRLVGIVTERDLLTHFCDCAKGLTVQDIMTPKKQLIIGHRDDTIDYAMQVITNNKIRHLPVLEGDKVIGLVSIGDVLKAHLQTVELENKMLEDYVNGALLVND